MVSERTRDEIERLRLLSNRGVAGGSIGQHRSLHRLQFPPQRLLVVLLLPMLFNLATWAVRNQIAAGWGELFQFWFSRLGLAASVSQKIVGSGVFSIALPNAELATRVPDAPLWWLTLALVVVVWLASSQLPDRLMPLGYFLRFICIIQASSLAFHAIMPSADSLTVPEYIESSFINGVWLILLIPWLHGLVFYIFDFSLAQKASLTFLTVGFIVAALPMQLIAHAWLLAECSTIILPLLYLVFDQWLLIFSVIALYAWGMSWRQNHVDSNGH